MVEGFLKSSFQRYIKLRFGKCMQCVRCNAMYNFKGSLGIGLKRASNQDQTWWIKSRLKNTFQIMPNMMFLSSAKYVKRNLQPRDQPLSKVY